MTTKPKSSKARGRGRVKPDLIALAAKAVPTNWCDPLLTGPNGLGNMPWDCRHIEKLLLGVRDRIRAISVNQ